MGKLIICTVPEASAAFEGLGNDDIHLPLGGSVSFPSDSSSDHYTLSLSKVEYDKGLFSPAVLNLHFSVSVYGNPTVAALKSSLIDSEMMVDVFDYDVKYAKGEDDGGKPEDRRRYVTQNHYVHGIEFSGRGATAECVLKCFSYDRKIKGGRACSVFTGEKFGNGIFQGQLDQTVLKDFYSFSPASLLMMGYHSENMKRDGYRDEVQQDGTKVQKIGHDAELVHPYLVRYNESLYDFFARVAHRCGEFLYFDGGKLHLGLPLDTIESIVTNTYPSIGEYGKSDPQYFWREIGGDADDNTELFSTDYLKGRLENSGSAAPYDMQHTSDDYLRLISSDDRVKSTLGWWVANNALTTFFTCTDALTGGVTAVWNAALDSLSGATYVPDMAESSFNDTYVKKGNDYATDIKNDTMQNLCNAYYAKIERLEEKSERGMLTLDYSDSLPSLGIGSAFASSDGMSDAYVVNRMYGSFSSVGGAVCRANSVEAVPVFKSAFDDLPGVVVPPRMAADISHYRKARPMEAVVTRCDDPLRLGRVKVRYPWQYDDGTGTVAQSPWIRIAVPFAGSQESSGGFMMTPQVGERVMVKYLADNIERPYVDGSLYSKSNKPSTSFKQQFLTGEAKGFVVSSPNGHSLKISDTADTNALEQLFPPLKPILDLVSYLGGGSYDSVLGEISGGGVTLSDSSGMTKVDFSPNKRSISISSNYGTVNISAFTGMTVSAPNGDIKIKGKNVTIEAGNNLTLNAGTNIKQEKNDYAAMLGTIVGEAAANMLNGTLKSYTGVDLSGCLDLTFIRCLWEIIMRPVEGTLSMKSNRNVAVTAGKGKVNVPVTMLSKAKKKNGFKDGWKTYDQFEADSPRRVYDSVQYFMIEIDTFYESEANAQRVLYSLNTALNQMMNQHMTKFSDEFKGKLVNTLFFLEQAIDKKDPITFDVVFGCPYVAGTAGHSEMNVLHSQYQIRYEELKTKVENYLNGYGAMGKLETAFTNVPQIGSVKAEVHVNQFPTGYKNNLFNLGSNKEKVEYDHSAHSGDIKNFIKIQKRSALLQALTSLGCKFCLNVARSDLATTEDIEVHGVFALSAANNDLSTSPLVNAITMGSGFRTKITACLKPPKPEEEPKKSQAKSFFGTLGAAVIQPLGGGGKFNSSTQQWEFFPQMRGIVNYNGEAGPRAVLYETSTNGNIMLSSDPGKTLHLKSDASGWYPTVNVSNSKLLKNLINSLTDLD